MYSFEIEKWGYKHWSRSTFTVTNVAVSDVELPIGYPKISIITQTLTFGITG